MSLLDAQQGFSAPEQRYADIAAHIQTCGQSANPTATSMTVDKK
jgi:hypothetical protein